MTMTGKIQISIAFEDATLRMGGKWVLQGINWRIGPGEHWVVQGPNGAGKTTLARALLGQVAVVKGRIRRSWGESNPQGPAMAMVSPEQVHQLHQREQLLAEMRHFSGRVDETTTGRQVLGGAGGGLADKGMPEGPGLKSIGALFGLAQLLDKPVEALSGGEMRKLLLARALGADPRLLILDEPFNNLDAASRTDLGAVLQDLMAVGVQLILITHHLGEVPRGFTHLLRLAKGKVAAQGPLPRSGRCAPAGPEPVAVGSGRSGSPRLEAPPLVDLRDVCVRYDATLVLDHVSWTVNPGEHWALIGPNGAGKTTLLKLITGDQLQGYANQVFLFGRRKGSGESVWQIKQQIGLVSDELHARYQKKVDSRDVISSGFFDSVGLYRRCTEAQKQIVGHWLRKLDLAALARERFDRLSFGQQRLILIARAMVKQPRLLILDEPCSGLDPAHRRKVLALLESLGSRGATQLIYVTHRPEELPACITHRLFLEAGKVRSQDPSSAQ